MTQIKYQKDGPTKRSYWIIPDEFAAGAYPGKEGKGSINVNKEVLQRLLDFGIDTFINLTEDETGGGDSFLEMYDPFLPDHCIVDRYPILDVSIPTEEFMVTILDAIDGHLAEGKVPYPLLGWDWPNRNRCRLLAHTSWPCNTRHCGRFDK